MLWRVLPPVGVRLMTLLKDWVCKQGTFSFDRNSRVSILLTYSARMPAFHIDLRLKQTWVLLSDLFRLFSVFYFRIYCQICTISDTIFKGEEKPWLPRDAEHQGSHWYHFNAFDMARPGRTHDISPPKRALLPLSYRDLSPPLSLICCLPPNNFLFSQHSRCYSDTCTMLIQVTRCIPSGHVRVLQYRRLPQSVIFDITVLFM